MTYKTLLVHVEASPDSNLRLRAAVDLAHDLRATLIGVGGGEPVYLDNPMMMDGEVDGALIQSLADFDVANLKDAEARFHAAVGPLGGAAIWLSAFRSARGFSIPPRQSTKKRALTLNGSGRW